MNLHLSICSYIKLNSQHDLSIYHEVGIYLQYPSPPTEVVRVGAAEFFHQKRAFSMLEKPSPQNSGHVDGRAAGAVSNNHQPSIVMGGERDTYHVVELDGTTYHNLSHVPL